MIPGSNALGTHESRGPHTTGSPLTIVPAATAAGTSATIGARTPATLSSTSSDPLATLDRHHGDAGTDQVPTNTLRAGV